MCGGSEGTAEYVGSGPVGILRSHDSSLGVNVDWFGLAGVSSLGRCPTSNGYVVFRIKDDEKGQRQFAIVLAARTNGATISVQIDDTYVDPTGYCYAQFVQQ